ncbi:MAG: carboxypeptidase-like regulatory domain-containing protein, partial [Armatimonadota bacterium]
MRLHRFVLCLVLLTAAYVCAVPAFCHGYVGALHSAPSAPQKKTTAGTTGQIVLPSTNSPLPMAALAGIKVYPVEWWRISLAATVQEEEAVKTDAQGRFRFAKKLDDDTLLLIVPPPSFGASPLSGIQPNRYASITFAHISDRGPNTFALARATRLTARFVDHDNKPLANRSVSFWPAETFESYPSAKSAGDTFARNIYFPTMPPEVKRLLTFRTGADGRCEAAGMAQKMEYSLRIDATPNRYPAPVLAQTLLTNASTRSDMPQVRLALNSVISGRVTLRRDGRPVVGTKLRLQGPLSFGRGTLGNIGRGDGVVTTTDGNGRYAFPGLYPGTFGLSAEVPSRLSGSGKGQFERYMTNPLFSGWISLRPAEQAMKRDFQIVEAATVIVHLHDREGRPLFGQDVVIQEIGSGGGFGRTSGSDGTAWLPGQPRRMRVRWDRSAERRRGPGAPKDEIKVMDFRE